MLESKTRDKKIPITDIAVDKVHTPKIPGLSENENKRFLEVNRELLRVAKTENDSNEVLFLYNPRSFMYEKCFGEGSKVDLYSSPNTAAMLRTSSEKELFLLHNHPSTRGFSYSNIGVFLYNDGIGGITAVTNAGVVHTLYKSENYSFDKAYELLFDIRKEYSTKVLDEEADADVVNSFLKKSTDCGILVL